MMLRHPRFVVRQSTRRHASTTEAAKDTTVKSKEAVSNASSKTSQGLSRVTSSAGPAVSGAAQGVSKAIGNIGGRTGRIISFVQSMIPPALYYGKVGFELSKLVFRGQKMSPPDLAAFQKYTQPFINAIRNPSSLLNRTTNTAGAMSPEGILSRMRNVNMQQLMSAGVVGVEVIGFFTRRYYVQQTKSTKSLRFHVCDRRFSEAAIILYPLGQLLKTKRMEMFKLLTRSSKIQKSNTGYKHSSSHHIPSNGIPDHLPQDFKNDDIFPSIKKARSRGIKRKRNGWEEKHDDGITEQLDPSKKVISSISLEHQTTDNQDGAGDKLLNVNATQSTNVVNPDLDWGERWRTLKKHKLKVTILGHISWPQNDHHNKKMRLDTAALGKIAHPQISPQPLTSFTQLRSKYGISKRLAANLDAQGYREPTEVQMGSLPLLLGTDEDRGLNARWNKKSELDLLTIAPTGSGKTLAFMIHVLHGLLANRQAEREAKEGQSPERRVQALIIAPTHELADQIVNEGRKLASGTGVRISGVSKGMRLHPYLVGSKDSETLDTTKDNTFRHANDFLVKADILVSTPLLVLHAISANQSGAGRLPEIRFLVLDEADVLLDPLFREQTLGIWTACTNASLQTSLWSATIGSSIEALAQAFILDRRRNLAPLSTPLQHHIVRLIVGLKDSAVPIVTHRLVYTASEQAPAADGLSLQPPFLVFTQTVSRAIALHSELLYDIPLEAGGSSRIAVLHSELSDTARSNVMAGFRKGEIWLIVTTDLLSRGVDFRGLNGVVNYDIPNTGASYVHRAGRTGRQGREGGVVVTLYTKEDIPYVKNVANVIAASQRAREKHVVADKHGEGVQKWLLDALPNVSKKMKKEMKRKGVEGRRVPTEAAGGKSARKMRISTKSGYERRIENKRKGAVDGSRKRLLREEAKGGLQDEEWEGFDD
ncbi:P-loop containing nucleoside triphosphate hydrolase protein [Usnea florida]